MSSFLLMQSVEMSLRSLMQKSWIVTEIFIRKTIVPQRQSCITPAVTDVRPGIRILPFLDSVISGSMHFRVERHLQS